MSEEKPFRSIKITLSEEALDILAELRKKGYFRSDSMTIEECIRTVYAISAELEANLLFLTKEKRRALAQEQSEWLKAVMIRAARFMSRERLVEFSKVDLKN